MRLSLNNTLTYLKGGELVGMRHNPKELGQVFKQVKTLQWDNGKDDVVVGRAKYIVEYFGEDFFINDIDEGAIDGLMADLNKKNISNATKNRYLSALSTMITFCQRRYSTYKLERRPFINWYKEPKHELRYVTEAEEQQMIKILNSWELHYRDDRDFYILLLDTGMRLNELRTLRVKDCFKGYITLYDTKNNQPRGVPLTSRSQEIVNRFTENKNPNECLFQHFAFWRPDTTFRKLRKAMGLEGDKRFTLHSFRRTLACRLLNKEVPHKVVQQWLGHSDVRMVERYATVLSTTLSKFVNVLEKSTNGLEPTDMQKPLGKNH